FRMSEAPSAAYTVLVVEDDTSVRRLICALLERAGYVVLNAGSGNDAIRVFNEHKNQIGVVLADVVMTDMTGPALIEKLHLQTSTVRFVYMSGYPEDMLAALSHLGAGVPFVRKPVNFADLLQKIRDLMGDTRPEGNSH